MWASVEPEGESRARLTLRGVKGQSISVIGLTKPGVVADEVWQRIEETALEVAALARELAGNEKDERN